jgi:hypothetical protein
MEPYAADEQVTLYAGDCLDVLRELPDASVDAVVTDPPAGIAFMGKAWDHDKGGRDVWVAWLAEVLREANRVCKPGAHAFVWALPRTSGWTHRALEDAGWTIRECVTHLFGSGFPKSHNLPGGLGTALKPGSEHWWLARKPLAGTVAGNVLAHGTGALNIDGCRVGTTVDTWPATRSYGGTPSEVAFTKTPGEVQRAQATGDAPAGRWPANVVLDPDAAGELDRQSGFQRARGNKAPTVGGGGMYDHDTTTVDHGAGDTAGASRFFYVAKAPTVERPRVAKEGVGNGRVTGLGGKVRQCNVCETRAIESGAKEPSCGHNDYRWAEPTTNVEHVAHPTVKPLDLMRWLVRLVTPPGGTVLDPFAGSGTTAEACIVEGFRCITVEREPDYLPLIMARLNKPIQPDIFGGIA